MAPPKAAAAPEAPTRKRKKFPLRHDGRWPWHRRQGGQRSGDESEPSTKPERQSRNAGISEEGMKRIIAATKKRWAAVKAAKAQQQKAAAKKTAKKKAVKKAAAAPAVAQAAG